MISLKICSLFSFSALEEMSMEQIENLYNHFKQKDELEKFSKIEDKILIYFIYC